MTPRDLLRLVVRLVREDTGGVVWVRDWRKGPVWRERDRTGAQKGRRRRRPRAPTGPPRGR